ncbi:hypothetical protein RF55_21166 [Lasius niger]|uniref:Uncharacterized protein n=1 Tax=Lasius niger TaxID=67767 RepID=A0A0J7JYA3_LASNI|nr:hypothetical protein RF55_21166 [Lasius niger]
MVYSIIRSGSKIWHFAVKFYYRTIHVLFPSRFFSDVVIEGFMNIENRQFIRACRRQNRDYLDDLWGDTTEAREWEENNSWMFTDVFDLKILFGLEPYYSDNEGESWDIQEDVDMNEEPQNFDEEPRA